MNPVRLRQAAEEWQRQRAYLLAEFPEIDPETLRDTLDGETDAIDLIASLVTAALADGYAVVALKHQIDDLEARKERFIARGEKRREIAASLMDAIGERKIERPAFTVSLRAAPQRLSITDLTAIPDKMYRVTRTLDTSAIKKTLLAGGSVPGAHMSNGSVTLSVRTR